MSSVRQQVVHEEQKHCVAQDEGHLKGGAVHRLGGQQEAEQVQCYQEAAGDQQVHYVEDRPTPQNSLGIGHKYNTLKFQLDFYMFV